MEYQLALHPPPKASVRYWWSVHLPSDPVLKSTRPDPNRALTQAHHPVILRRARQQRERGAPPAGFLKGGGV